MKRLRSLWQRRLGPAVARVRRLFPLKFSGIVLFLGAGFLLYYFGLERQDLILLMTSVVLLVVASLDVLLVIEASFATYRWWKAQQPHLPLEITPLMVETPGRIGLHRRPPWRPLVEVSWRWIEPQGVEVGWVREFDQVYEEFRFHHRCLLSQVEREFEIADVLGFACIRLRWKQQVRISVLPVPQPLNRNAFVTSFHGGDDMSDPRGEPVGDRVDMRQYAAGDPPKLLLWKLYARTGKLMVRQPERAISPTPKTCAYLVAGPQDETVAGVMRALLESGVLGVNWRFGADGNQGHCSDLSEALTFLARSGNLSHLKNPGTGLGGFLEQAAKDGFNGCLVALPSQPGPWLEAVQQAARVRNIEISWAATPGFLGGRPTQGWWGKLEPWIFLRPPHQVPGEPEKVLQSLAGIGKERWLYQPARQGFVRFGGKLG